MATKVSAIGGLVKIEGPLHTDYINRAELGVEFTPRSTVKLKSEFLEISTEVAFSEFQDGAGAAINTEDTIVVYLDSLI